MSIEDKIAKGSEGQVWRGRLRGHGLVAIKTHSGPAMTWERGQPVWREAEVAGACM